MSNPYYQQWLDQTKAKLISEYDRLNFRASGSYAEALEGYIISTQNKDIIGMLGANHSQYMVKGRGATAENKRGRLWGIIQKWVKDKQIQPKDPNMTIKTLAWLIARKIDMQGYSVANRQGVIDNVLTDEWINDLIFKAGAFQGQIIVRDLQQLLKSA